MKQLHLWKKLVTGFEKKTVPLLIQKSLPNNTDLREHRSMKKNQLLIFLSSNSHVHNS